MAGRSGQGKSECQKPSGEGTVLARALRRNQPAPVKASGTWRNPLTRSPAGRGKPGLGGTGERKAWADAASRCSRPFSRLWKIKRLPPDPLGGHPEIIASSPVGARTQLLIFLCRGLWHLWNATGLLHYRFPGAAGNDLGILMTLPGDHRSKARGEASKYGGPN